MDEVSLPSGLCGLQSSVHHCKKAGHHAAYDMIIWNLISRPTHSTTLRCLCHIDEQRHPLTFTDLNVTLKVCRFPGDDPGPKSSNSTQSRTVLHTSAHNTMSFANIRTATLSICRRFRILHRWTKRCVSFIRGNTLAGTGTGTSRNLQRGSQPSATLNSRRRSLGTILRTCS